MRVRLATSLLAICMTQACTTTRATVPAIEQGIYRPAPPLVDIKQAFYVRERERPLLPHITEASDAIAHFLIDMHNGTQPAATEARSTLRLPPSATLPSAGRFVNATLYCWESDAANQLKFLVEWADVTTHARYTDSYVFVKRGTSWQAATHGSYAPWHWTQTERYFQRTCP